MYMQLLYLIISSLNLVSGANEDYGVPLFLSPYLEAGKIEEAQKLSKVTPDIGNLTSYSGFLTVDKECESFLHFWFVPAQEGDWKSKPVVLWQQGGPGFTGFFGLFLEIGPFEYFKSFGLTKRKYSWNIKNNLLIIDNPPGVGFSFTRKNCYAKSSEAVSTTFLSGLKEFYRLFPALESNKFILSGESYAGKYLPVFASRIHENNMSSEKKINLTAVFIGGAYSDPITFRSSLSTLYNQLGLIDEDQKAQYVYFENRCVAEIKAQNWKIAHDYCNPLTDLFFNIFTGTVNKYNFDRGSDFDEESYVEFLQLPSTRKSLHVGKLLFDPISNKVYNKLSDDYLDSVKSYVEEMLPFYPFIFLFGQNDLICPYTLGVEFLRSLDWNNQTQYLEARRILWWAEEDVVGFYKGTYHLYDIMMRSCGHYFPRDQPNISYIAINSIAAGSPDNPLKDFVDYDTIV